MKDIHNICIITYGYPTEKKPYLYTFVDKLVCAMADNNVKCTVINPIGITYRGRKEIPPLKWDKITKKGNKIEVLCPRYVYCYAKDIVGFNTGVFTFKLFKKSVEKTMKEYNINPDCLYAHFIYPAGATAAIIGKRMNLPTFFAYGESTPWGINILGENRLKEYFNSINGVVAVSTAKKNELLRYNIVPKDKISVFPNAIDREVFYSRSKEEMRKKYGFYQNDFIVGYTGRFNESKGVMRLLEAIKDIKDIKLVLIGGGELNPESDRIVFKGQLPHDEVPMMLSACDIFVLPTKNEGCCNAIVEAMGCGLPIISSDKDFNYDILSADNSILVDPDNIDEIQRAILKLLRNKNNREDMSNKSISIAEQLTIEDRASKILNWMNKNCFKR